jgi:purine-binding chemotaxis protein CheW
MVETAITKQKSGLVELVTFYLSGAQYGIDILKVQEINKLRDWTPVPQSDSFVLGILSLRGNIVTIIDLGRKLGLDQTRVSHDSRTIIAKLEEQCVGFLVDVIGNVTTANWDQVCQPPANVNGVESHYLEGVLKTEERLITLLNMEEVFKEVEVKSQAKQSSHEGRI